jgi:cellulose synthase/poly-beta-1,6-N-acetylglucosamine synthase-like glycosyltransferase
MINVDLLGLIALICIWALLMINQVLVVAGYWYYVKVTRSAKKRLADFPYISILVPAHNEAKVIGNTVASLLGLDYPADRYEIIVINDNSTDSSKEILEAIQKDNPGRALHVIHTDRRSGNKGKSNALNIGYRQSKGAYLVVYDADNTPERDALRYLVAEIVNDDKLAAVIGKFRTRNRNVNLLTRFINIETLSFQWMAQAGRWQLFNLCTIPGTNFIIRRDIIDEIGGWDVKAVAEDTELSFRIYAMGYKIKFMPLAVTWEQEPQTLKVWFRQRVRWVKGNIYVLIKHIPILFSLRTHRVKFDMLYFLSIYFVLLGALIISDSLFLLNALGLVHMTLASLSILLWLMAIFLFTVTIFTTLTTEKGEMRLSNLFITLLMYFTYCKLWMIVAAYGLIQYLIDIIFKRGFKWYKTERY